MNDKLQDAIANLIEVIADLLGTIDELLQKEFGDDDDQPQPTGSTGRREPLRRRR